MKVKNVKENANTSEEVSKKMAQQSKKFAKVEKICKKIATKFAYFAAFITVFEQENAFLTAHYEASC